MGWLGRPAGILKNFLWILALAFPMSLITIQHFTPYDPHSLYGYFEPARDPVCRLDSCLTGGYQRQKAEYLNTNFGHRDFFVRLYNQVDYSLFGVTHAERIVKGKHGFLYATNYIDEYLGKGPVRRNFIAAKVRELKILQEVLWNRYHIFLYPVFAADKGTVYPEYLPSRYRRMPKKVSHYEYYIRQCALQGVQYFDANRYFLTLKDTSRYPLYPPTGIHWSEYGAVLVADTVFRALQDYTGIPVPELRIRSLKVSGNLLYGDDDILRTMNLLCNTDHPPGAYPVLGYTKDTTSPKPAALFIGDSFFWQWYNIGIIHNTFRNVDFWYYDDVVFPVSFVYGKNTWQVNLREEVLKQNFIIIVSTNGGAGNFGSGFIDRLYAEFDPSPDNPIRWTEQRMMHDPRWIHDMVTKARQMKLPLDYVVRRDAIFLYNESLYGLQN